MLKFLIFRSSPRCLRLLIQGPEIDFRTLYKKFISELALPEYNPVIPFPSIAAEKLNKVKAACEKRGLSYRDIEGLFIYDSHQLGYSIVEYEEVELI